LFRNKIRNRGGVAQIVRRYGLLHSIDIFLIYLNSILAKRFYRARLGKFGFSEAIWHSRSIDGWCRYQDVAREVVKMDSTELKVLDVGSSGHGGLNLFRNFKLTMISLDIQRSAFEESDDKRFSVVADGCYLPFKDNAVDIGLSVASAEHFPRSIRNKLFQELKRIANHKVILYMPVTSENGEYQGRTYDIKFLNTFKRLLGYEEGNTAEHIVSIHPSINDLKNEFPDAQFLGRKNCDDWYKYMVFSSAYIIGFLAGFVYYLFWREHDRPPYYECMVIYDSKPSS
tara:strand:- start:62 stop:916 length:855 start_codon:yes stop_codon:yes gene_type:complete